MIEGAKIYNICDECNGVGTVPVQGGSPITCPLCNGEKYRETGIRETSDTILEIKDTVNDIKDIVDDILEKLNE